MIDYDAARAKVKKLVEKPSEDPTKLPRVSFVYHGHSRP
jgi:amphiphysin